MSRLPICRSRSLAMTANRSLSEAAGRRSESAGTSSAIHRESPSIPESGRASTGWPVWLAPAVPSADIERWDRPSTCGPGSRRKELWPPAETARPPPASGFARDRTLVASPTRCPTGPVCRRELAVPKLRDSDCHRDFAECGELGTRATARPLAATSTPSSRSPWRRASALRTDGADAALKGCATFDSAYPHSSRCLRAVRRCSACRAGCTCKYAATIGHDEGNRVSQVRSVPGPGAVHRDAIAPLQRGRLPALTIEDVRRPSLHRPIGNLAMFVFGVQVKVGVRIHPLDFGDGAFERDGLLGVEFRIERVMADGRSNAPKHTKTDCNHQIERTAFHGP